MDPREEFGKATDVSRETLEKFRIYHDLLLAWQKKINLIGRGTEKEIWRRHFLDSAQLLPLVNKHTGFPKGRTWLDIGTGAGFPGLVLALMGEEVSMVEPNSKKCAFLRAVLRETGTQARVYNSKVEDLSPFPVDLVTARALTSIGRLIAWGRAFLKEASEIWLLKGETAEQELTSALKNNNMAAELFQSLTDPRGKVVRIRNKAVRRGQAC